MRIGLTSGNDFSIEATARIAGDAAEAMARASAIAAVLQVIDDLPDPDLTYDVDFGRVGNTAQFVGMELENGTYARFGIEYAYGDHYGVFDLQGPYNGYAGFFGGGNPGLQAGTYIPGGQDTYVFAEGGRGSWETQSPETGDGYVWKSRRQGQSAWSSSINRDGEASFAQLNVASATYKSEINADYMVISDQPTGEPWGGNYAVALANSTGGQVGAQAANGAYAWLFGEDARFEAVGAVGAVGNAAIAFNAKRSGDGDHKAIIRHDGTAKFETIRIAGMAGGDVDNFAAPYADYYPGGMGVGDFGTSAYIYGDGLVDLVSDSAQIKFNGDTRLQRSAASTLKLDDGNDSDATLIVGPEYDGPTPEGTYIYGYGLIGVFPKGGFDPATQNIFETSAWTDSVSRHNMMADGQHQWGNGTDAHDVRLRRSAAKTLTIDDAVGGAADLRIAGDGRLRTGGFYNAIYEPDGTNNKTLAVATNAARIEHNHAGAVSFYTDGDGAYIDGNLNFTSDAGVSDLRMERDSAGSLTVRGISNDSRLVVKGIVGQTGAMQQWKDSDGGVRAMVRGDGLIGAPYFRHQSDTGPFIQTGGSLMSIRSSNGPAVLEVDTGLRLVSPNVDIPAVVVRGQPSQNADLQQWRNSNDVVLSKVRAADGAIFAPLISSLDSSMYMTFQTSENSFKFSGGDLSLEPNPGRGLKLKSPDGLITKTLTIDNSGNEVWT